MPTFGATVTVHKTGPAVVKCAVCGQDCMAWLPDALPVCEPCDIKIEDGDHD